MIGIIGAMMPEIEHLTNIMEEKTEKQFGSLKFVSGKIHNKDVVCTVCGIGKVYAAIAAQTMILFYKADMIINTGVAGGLNKTLKIFDIAVAESVVEYDMDTTAFGDPLGFISGLDRVYLKADREICNKLLAAGKMLGLNCEKCVIASGDKFVEDTALKKFLNETFDASACEMEGAGVGQTCLINNIPFGIIRCISDSSDSDHNDYNEFMKKAAKNSADVMELFIKNL